MRIRGLLQTGHSSPTVRSPLEVGAILANVQNGPRCQIWNSNPPQFQSAMEVTPQMPFEESGLVEGLQHGPLPARRKRSASQSEAEPEESAAEPEPEPEGGAAAEVRPEEHANRVIAEVRTDSRETTLDRRLEKLAASDAQDAAEAYKNLDGEHQKRMRIAQDVLDKDVWLIAQDPQPGMSSRLQERMRKAADAKQEAERELAIEKAAIDQAQGRMPDWCGVAKMLYCPVLMRNTAYPVMLTCGHTLDRGVARELFAESEGVFPCPVCRTPNTKPIAKTGAGKNTLLGRLARALVGKGV